MSLAALTANQKFGLLAIENVYADLPKADFRLADGTWVLQRIPVEIEAHWVEWIGTIRAGKMLQGNVVLLKSLDSASPEIAGDDEQIAITNQLTKLFYVLQLENVLEYEGADLLAGGVVAGAPMVRSISTLPKFLPSRGYSRVSITEERFRRALDLRSGLEQIERQTPKFARFIRGLNILMAGLREQSGQERLHQFVRSLEALIIPDTGKTRRQFVHRCQTFATAAPQIAAALAEAFDMRSDAEHLHDWNRALGSHSAAERENIALLRTRQMERLAAFSYERIIGNSSVWSHFDTDDSQSAFWSLSEAARILVWGAQLSLAAIPLVTDYDQWGRAAFNVNSP